MKLPPRIPPFRNTPDLKSRWKIYYATPSETSERLMEKLKIAKDFDDTENANHAVKVFEAQIINETLHDHVG